MTQRPTAVAEDPVVVLFRFILVFLGPSSNGVSHTHTFILSSRDVLFSNYKRLYVPNSITRSYSSSVVFLKLIIDLSKITVEVEVYSFKSKVSSKGS